MWKTLKIELRNIAEKVTRGNNTYLRLGLVEELYSFDWLVTSVCCMLDGNALIDRIHLDLTANMLLKYYLLIYTCNTYFINVATVQMQCFIYHYLVKWRDVKFRQHFQDKNRGWRRVIGKNSIFETFLCNPFQTNGIFHKVYCWVRMVHCIYWWVNNKGGQWLSGGVLDSRLRGCGFEPHRRHCVMSLSKTH